MVICSREELRDVRAAHLHHPSAVVMTMGALHKGHAQLMNVARKNLDSQGAGHLTATIFVNPLQFGVGEDLDAYPRTFEADVALCAAAGVDVIFAPTPAVMYPNGDPQVTLAPGILGEQFEGAARPGHFSGMLTVVNKLLNLTAADTAYFGEKDYQQLTLIRRMVRDLELSAQIVGVPTVRADDGLALSSRNAYLSTEQRAIALMIPAAIRDGVNAARSGAEAQEVRDVALARLQQVDGLQVEYVAVTDPLMGPPPEQGEARLIITATVGKTRLLDNSRIDFAPRTADGDQ